MGKHIKFAVSLVCLCGILSGCANNTPVVESDIYKSEIVSNPFESKPQSQVISNSANSDKTSVTSDTSEPYTLPVPSAFSFGIYGNENKFVDNGTLTVPMTLNIDKQSEAGVHVFLDGVPQKFGLESGSDKKIYNEYSMQHNFDETCLLSIDAKFDENIETHTITGVGLGHVEFTPTSPHPTFAFYQGGMSPNSFVVDTSENDINYTNDFKITNADAPEVMKQEQKPTFSQGDRVKAVQKNGDTSVTNYVLNPDETQLNLIVSCGTLQAVEPYTYRVSVYKNHELAKFNGGCDLIDMKCETGKCSTAELTVDDVKVGDFVYVIAVPIETEGIGAVKTETCMITNPDLSF